jgi:hypothetical protein
MEERRCSAYSDGKCNIEVTLSKHNITLMMCDCVEYEFCPLMSKGAREQKGLIFFHPGTCGFYDRAAGINQCFQCHHTCGGRRNMTDCERDGILGGYRLNPVVEEFMLQMHHNGHYGVGALTPEFVAAVRTITQEMVYELKSRYNNGAGPSMATLLRKLGDPASTTVSSDIPLKSLPPWAVSFNDASSVQEH